MMIIIFYSFQWKHTFSIQFFPLNHHFNSKHGQKPCWPSSMSCVIIHSFLWFFLTLSLLWFGINIKFICNGHWSHTHTRVTCLSFKFSPFSIHNCYCCCYIVSHHYDYDKLNESYQQQHQYLTKEFDSFLLLLLIIIFWLIYFSKRKFNDWKFLFKNNPLPKTNVSD